MPGSTWRCGVLWSPTADELWYFRGEHGRGASHWYVVHPIQSPQFVFVFILVFCIFLAVVALFYCLFFCSPYNGEKLQWCRIFGEPSWLPVQVAGVALQWKHLGRWRVDIKIFSRKNWCLFEQRTLRQNTDEKCKSPKAETQVCLFKKAAWVHWIWHRTQTARLSTWRSELVGKLMV